MTEDHQLAILPAPISDIRLKAPVAISIHRTGKMPRHRFEGRFKELPLILRADGATRPQVIRELGRGLALQYYLLKEVKIFDELEGTAHFQEFQRNVLTALEAVIEPAA